MAQSLTIEREVSDGEGYSLSHSLSSAELDKLYKFITDQWLYRIQIEDPKIVSYIIKNKLQINDYHQIATKLDHAGIWSKVSRVLSSSFADWFLATEFSSRLQKEFGEFTVSDEENLGWPNFYWRIVRPQKKNDVGPIHRDSWFWDLNTDFPKPDYSFHRVKVWIAICSEPGQNGLLLEPSSQKRKDIRWSGEMRHGIQKPVLKMKENELDMELVVRGPGQAIIFNDKLLHGGSINRGVKSRISMEFTMLVRDY